MNLPRKLDSSRQHQSEQLNGWLVSTTESFEPQGNHSVVKKKNRILHRSRESPRDSSTHIPNSRSFGRHQDDARAGTEANRVASRRDANRLPCRAPRDGMFGIPSTCVRSRHAVQRNHRAPRRSPGLMSPMPSCSQSSWSQKGCNWRSARCLRSFRRARDCAS
jgi:hypothetical protein